MTEQLQSFFMKFDERVIVPDKNWDIRGMFSEGWRPDGVSAQAIIQFAAKASLSDLTAAINFDPTPGKIFGVPVVDRYGSSPPKMIQGPGRHNWNLSLLKNIKAAEKINM
jgi:hypothetical protein